MEAEDYSKIVVNSNMGNLLAIYDLTRGILNDYYITFAKSNNETYIPIEKIVEWLGLKIIVKDINRYDYDPIAILKREEKAIYISSSIGYSKNEKRFAIARMLGYFILSKASYNDFRQFSINGNNDDYVAEIFASFILVPPIDLLKFLNNYYKNNHTIPFDYEKYMIEAADYYKIPFVYMFATFERMRMLLIEISFKNTNREVEDIKLGELERKLRNNIPIFLR